MVALRGNAASETARTLEMHQLLHQRQTFAAVKPDDVKHESYLLECFIAIILADVYTTLQQHLCKEWESIGKGCGVERSLFRQRSQTIKNAKYKSWRIVNTRLVFRRLMKLTAKLFSL
jgi:hypothetical protein